jgi:hypothetical protein
MARGEIGSLRANIKAMEWKKILRAPKIVFRGKVTARSPEIKKHSSPFRRASGILVGPIRYPVGPDFCTFPNQQTTGFQNSPQYLSPSVNGWNQNSRYLASIRDLPIFQI